MLQTEPSSPVGRTSNHCPRQDDAETNASATPQKRTSSRTPVGTPAKRLNISPPENKSPRKYPASPAGLRAGLRSGTTPQKLRQIVTTPKKDTDNSLNFSPENEPYSEKLSRGKLNSSVTSANSASSPLPASPSKTPVKKPLVVLKREEFTNGNSDSGSSSLSASPVKTPTKKLPYPKFPESPVATRTDMHSSDDCSRHILSPTIRGTPRKSHRAVGDDTALETEMRSTSSVSKRSLGSSSTSGMKEEDLPSVRRCGRPPVVIVLEDFECFRSQLVQDLITICG